MEYLEKGNVAFFSCYNKIEEKKVFQKCQVFKISEIFQ